MMLHRITRRRPSVPTLLALLALGVALSATNAYATPVNFLLNTSNTSSSATTLDASAVAGKGLQLTNNNLTSGATALGLTVAPGHTPFTVSSGTKVARLNADKLDGIDSTGFVPASGFLRVGPVIVPGLGTVPLATIGNLSFEGQCIPFSEPDATTDRVVLLIASSAAHSTYGAVTQAAAGGQLGDGDMPINTYEPIADWNQGGGGQPDFNPATGSAVEANGHQVTFDLYQGINDQGQTGQCIFGGTFAVK